MTELHPAVKNIIESGKYVPRRGVEEFTEHELKDRQGNVTRKVTKDDLEKFAHVCNEKARNGALSPIGAGHTFDDVFDDKGQVVQKFPEEKQPRPLGYLLNWRVGLNPHSNKYSLYADEWIQKTITDPQTGQPVDGLQYSATFPRRSAEAYHDDKWIDWVAMLRRAPRLDLGLQAYEKLDPDHCRYERTSKGEFSFVGVEMARGKFRYSMDTGGDHMAEPATGGAAGGTPPPTEPPSAAPPPANPNPGSTEGELPPLHKEAAEKYAMHSMGMHHTRAKALMQHMHQKYGAECGLQGDMMTPYAAGAPAGGAMGSGTSVPPTASATPPATGPAAPSHSAPEPSRMQQDQANIEKARYEKQLTDLAASIEIERNARLAAEDETTKTYYERQLMQLVYEGYKGVDAEAELKFVTDRKYSRAQFDDHVAILRRLPRAPVDFGGDLPPLGMPRDFVTPAGTNPTSVSRDPLQDPEKFNEVQRYMRRTGSTWDEAKEKYSKNGVAAK